jgi:hypothetical protein
MESELESKVAELESVREERCDGVDGCEGARRGVAGAIVSSSPADWSSTNVALLLKSMGAPQLEQKRPVEEISALQEEQNIPGGFYHRAFGWRTA